MLHPCSSKSRIKEKKKKKKNRNDLDILPSHDMTLKVNITLHFYPLAAEIPFIYVLFPLPSLSQP